MGSLGLALIQPQIGVDPLGGYSRQLLLDRTVTGEVPVHQMTCCLLMQRIGSLRCVRQKGACR
jgi:hypothetical protein